MNPETREIRIKRMRMRAWHRGMKEMDLILGRWADRHLEAADEARLTLFEKVLAEDDHDLYLWISGQQPAPRYMIDFAVELSKAANLT